MHIECPNCKILKEENQFEYRADTKKKRRICSMCHKGYRSNLMVRRKNEDYLFSINQKECSKCHDIKDLEYFHKDKNTYTGYCSRCKSCISYLQVLNKDRIKKSLARVRYGINGSKYDELMSVVKCQICEKTFDDVKYKCIDHCHELMVVRGVLCFNCNAGLGMFKDDVISLQNAINYLNE